MLLTFAQYLRRLDEFDFRAKRSDLPCDASKLLALARDIELEERIILDRTDKGE